MYNYGEKLDIKQYYKKRFLGIYPMFWIAYSLVFLYIFYECKGIPFNLPLKRLILSFFAMDGYLSSYIESFYLIGEWFLGCIVLIYLVFPLLQKVMNRFPKISIIIAVIIMLGIIIFYTNGIMPINQNLFVCMFSFFIGMYMIKYISNYKAWYAIVAVILAIGLWFIPTTKVNYTVFIGNLIGYNLFIVLAYIGEKITNIKIQNLFNLISKYSYAVFLVHHYIIMKMESTFQNVALYKEGVICLYLCCWIVIGISAKILYYINEQLVQLLFRKREKEKIEG